METPSGRYIRSMAGHQTFFPNPLPPELIISSALQNKIEQTTHALGKVEMCRKLLPNADLLIYSSPYNARQLQALQLRGQLPRLMN